MCTPRFFHLITFVFISLDMQGITEKRIALFLDVEICLDSRKALNPSQLKIIPNSHHIFTGGIFTRRLRYLSLISMNSA